MYFDDHMMVEEICLNGKKIEYNIQYKNVKNINLRIKPDGTIYVSANKRVAKKIIDEFIRSKSSFILNALEKFNDKSKTPLKQYFTEEEVCDFILKVCKRIYPYFEKRGIDYPKIKFREMISRWGSCHPTKGIVTFNTNLMYAPTVCVEYVVMHEFTHFLQANHSDKFYEELSKICPDWKECRRILKEINIRHTES